MSIDTSCVCVYVYWQHVCMIVSMSIDTSCLCLCVLPHHVCMIVSMSIDTTCQCLRVLTLCLYNCIRVYWHDMSVPTCIDTMSVWLYPCLLTCAYVYCHTTSVFIYFDPFALHLCVCIAIPCLYPCVLTLHVCVYVYQHTMSTPIFIDTSRTCCVHWHTMPVYVTGRGRPIDRALVSWVRTQGLVIPMTYQIDTCHSPARCSAL